MDVLRRKAGRVEAGTAGGLDRAFRLALARAARDELALPLDIGALQDMRVSLAELIEGLAERSLIVVLDLPDGEGLGLFAMEPAVLSGLIAMVTTGRAAAATAPSRRPTRTDAAMVAPLVDAMLTRLASELSGQDDADWAAGWRYASFLEDARPLALLLDDAPFRLLRADVVLAGGAGGGQVRLALPAVAAVRRAAPPPRDDAQTDAEGAAFAAALTRQIEAVPCRIEAELVRLTLPLARAMALAPGDVLPLGDATVARMTLRGIDGALLAEGRLGQTRGQRAVRLTLPVAEDLRLEG